MSTIITGNASSVSNHLTKTVIDATNASPIVIQTSASHLFATGDTVTISGVTGNTAANGTFVITVTDATHFSLNGSTGSGAYVSGGTAIDKSLTPQFTIPSDGDTRNAASVNVALQALADRTQFLALIANMRSKSWIANGSWTAPADVLPIGILVGCGGGGGGAGGSAGVTSTDVFKGGSGGGAGAVETVQFINLTSGETYDIVIGDGGVSAASTVVGNDGVSSTFSDSTPTVLATFKGGLGGQAFSAGVTDPAKWGFAPGGQGTAGSTKAIDRTQHADVYILPPGPPGSGGFGSVNIAASPGTPSVRGYAGGVVGTEAADSGSYRGGGSGGGGGGGPYGTGGAAGSGGAGNNAGGGTAGTAGTAAAANTGAGGGGGGGGGCGTTSGGAGGAGGAGGSGMLTLYYFGSPS